jgi:hypothetical protein
MGPLSLAELDSIKSNLVEPELDLCFKQGQVDPPVKEFGFRLSAERESKLYDHIASLEARDILKRGKVGSGKFTSPGFAVRKSGDRIGLVVKYCSLNSRLELPNGIMYHDASRFAQSIPSFAKFYTVLEVKDAFHRVKIAESAIPFLHMSVYHSTGWREYAWQRAPQGLSCSPAFWIQLI